MAIYLILLLFISNAFADDSVNSGGILNKGILLTTIDGGTTVKAKSIKVSNGTLTDNGDGTATIATGSSSSDGNGWTSTPSVIYTTVSTNNVGIGSTIPEQRLVIGDGTSATRYISFSGGRGYFGYDSTASASNGGLAISAGNLKGLDVYVGGTNGSPLSGTKALAITSGGNIGIGSGTPNAKLVIKDTGTLPTIGATTALIVSDTSAASDSGILSLISGASGFSTLNFGDTASENIGLIQYAHPRDSFDFRAGGGIVMSVHGNTNVGIGTIIPTVEAAYRGLEIKSVTNAGSQLVLDTTDSDRMPTLVFEEANVAKWKIYNETVSDSLRFKTGAIDALVVSSAGNIGIGTTTPAGALTVMNGNVGIGTWAPEGLLQINKPSSSPFIVTAAGNVGIGTIYPQGAFIVTSGSVGIGTWVPVSGYKLSIRGNQYFPSGDKIDWGSGNAYIKEGGFALQFATWTGTAETEKMRILGDGNVGIGTTTPAGALTVMNGNVGIGTWVPSSPLSIKTGLTLTTKQSAANQACNTTCGSFSCYLGQDTATFAVTDCADATADVCICSK